MYSNNHLTAMNWSGCELIQDGFSSEEDVKEDIFEQKYEMKGHDISNQDEKQELKLQIPPPQDIKERAYSLEPDTMTGWTPKIFFPKPIPTFFRNQRFDCAVDSIMKAVENSPQIQLCYFGPRFQSTYFAWRNLNFPFPYNHLNQPKQMKNTTRKFCGQNSKFQRDETIRFDSIYESGNLDCAFKVGQFEYDLFMRVDSNTRGHLHWYNFKITNLSKGQLYRFNICNFRKIKSLYTRGMKPFAISKKQSQNQGKGWHQIGQNVEYQCKIPKVFKILNIKQQDNNNYKLSFSFQTKYEDDEIQIAYCVPYTYTQLLQKIDQMQLKFLNDDIISVGKLCISLGGLKVPLITITQNASDEQNCIKAKKRQTNKKVVFIVARIHPGQSNSSHMLNGFLDFICQQSKYASSLRKHIIFKIIPMMNPDGVAIGNYRTGLSGKDFNREFIDPDKYMFVQVYELKQLLLRYKSVYHQNLMMFLDFHGHSVKKNVFAYGPDFPIVSKWYYESRVFTKIISKQTDMFRYHSCSFKISEGKEATARAVLIRNLAIPFTYTIQASNGYYYDPQKLKDIQFIEGHWYTMGTKIGESLYEYQKMLRDIEEIKCKKREAKEKKIKEKREKVMTKQALISMNRGLSSVNSNYRKSLKYVYFEDSQQNQISQENKFTFQSLFDEIKKDSQKINQSKCSDDEISQGKSDSQNEADDFLKEEMSLFIDLVKNNRSIIQKLHTSKPLKHSAPESDPFIEIDPPQKEQQKQFLKSPNKKRDLPKQVYRRKKLASASGSQSPIKQKKSDQASIAKIINFSFVLNPISGFKASTSMSGTNGFEEKSRKIKTQAYCCEVEPILLKRQTDLSESSRRSFMSIQKDMIRRSQNQKRGIRMHSTLPKQPPSVNEVVGRKIVMENSD